MEEWERREQEAWEVYARTRAEVAGVPVDHAFVKSRMESFRKYSLETDQRWRAHRRL
jgi:hypothetical protein